MKKIYRPRSIDAVKVEETYSVHAPQPQTELEKQIVERLGWKNYFFQFPEVTKYTVRKIKRLNLDKEEIEYFPVNMKINDSKINKHSAWRFFPEKETRNGMSARFFEYCQYIHLPDDFKDKFPYLYAIIKDYYLVNYANSKNLRRMKRKMQGLVKLNIDYITIIFYQHYLLKQMPNFEEICNNDLFMKNFIEDVSHILKLVFTKGMLEDNFNELLNRTIKTIKKLKKSGK